MFKIVSCTVKWYIDTCTCNKVMYRHTHIHYTLTQVHHTLTQVQHKDALWPITDLNNTCYNTNQSITYELASTNHSHINCWSAMTFSHRRLVWSSVANQQPAFMVNKTQHGCLCMELSHWCTSAHLQIIVFVC